jgi:hypothetical protein
MKPYIVKGYGGEHADEPREWRLWVVVVSDETMFGFIAKSEAETFFHALQFHSLADAERLRRVALVCLENGKFTTPAILFEP